MRLQILGIEVIQAVQRFSLGDSDRKDPEGYDRGFSRIDPGESNSVPLVARKRTLVRVYVDSGMQSEYIEVPDPHYGEPAHRSKTKKLLLGGLPNVSGTLTLQPAFGPDLVVRPINPDQVVTAHPPDQIHRNDLSQTLNFVLSHKQLSGRVRLAVEVHLGGAGTRSITSFFFRFMRRSVLGLMFGLQPPTSTPVEFQERRLPRELVHLLVNHPAALAQPTVVFTSSASVR